MRTSDATRTILVALFVSALPVLVRAQCAIEGPGVKYVTAPRDTLTSISERFLASASRWPIIQAANRILDPHKLIPGQTIFLPSKLLSGVPQSARTLQVLGDVWVANERTRSGLDSQSLAWHRLLPLQDIGPGSLVRVGPSAFATLQLPDKSTVSLPAGSVLGLDRLCWSPAALVHTVRIRLDQGRIETRVAPQHSGSRFEVTTPLAVASVRGTEFGIEIVKGNGTDANDDAKRSMIADVTEGRVEVTSKQARVNVNIDQGIRVLRPGVISNPIALLRAPDLSAIETLQVSTALALPVGAVDGAVRYRFRVTSDVGLRQVLVDSSDSDLPIRVAGLPSGSYHVSIRAEDADGLPGHQSTVQVQLRTTPEPPLLQKPIQGGTVSSKNIELACTQQAGLAGYAVQLSQRADFAAPGPSVSLSPTCELAVSKLSPGAWYWRAAAVAAGSDGGTPLQGPWSAPEKFEVVAEPQTPTLRAGVDEESGALRFAFGVYPGETVFMQIALDPQFQHLVHQEAYVQSSATLILESGQTYYLRVRATDKHGFNSEYGAAQQIELSRRLSSGSGGSLKDESGHPITVQ